MGHDTDRFDLRGVDLTFIGEIDDKAKAVFNFSYHDDDVSLEEGYLDVWKILPYETDLRLGRFRVNFGLLNTIHPHALAQVDYPAIYREFLGHEGYIDEGVGLAGEFSSPWENPFGWSLQVVSGNRHEHGEDDDHGDEHEEGDYKRLKDFDDTPFIARLKHRFTPSDRLSIDWGLSGLTGRFEDDDDTARYWLEGADLTLTGLPLRISTSAFAGSQKRFSPRSTAVKTMRTRGAFTVSSIIALLKNGWSVPAMTGPSCPWITATGCASIQPT